MIVLFSQGGKKGEPDSWVAGEEKGGGKLRLYLFQKGRGKRTVIGQQGYCTSLLRKERKKPSS